MPLRLQICRQESRQSTKEQEESGDEDAERDGVNKDFTATTTCHHASDDSDHEQGKSKEENGRPSGWVMKPTGNWLLTNWFACH
jgi:hypothetical protein